MNELALVIVGGVLALLGNYLGARMSREAQEAADRRALEAAREERVESAMLALLEESARMRALALATLGSKAVTLDWEAYSTAVESALTKAAVVRDDAMRASLEDWINVAWLADELDKPLGRAWTDIAYQATDVVDALAGAVIRGTSAPSKAFNEELLTAMRAERTRLEELFAAKKPKE